MRIALIGLGAAGRNHLQVIHQLPDAELVGIADLDAERTEALRERYGVPMGTTDPGELIADDSLDAIAIAAGDKAHHPLVMACAAAGRHVIIEKPLATEIDHGREMVAAMRDAGKLLCVTFNNRAGVATRKLKELIDAGTIGRLRMLRLVGLMAAPDNRIVRDRIGEPAAYARLQNICGDGKNALFDCGVHSFDYARWVCGADYQRIEAMGYDMRGLEYPDHGVALCEMANGVFVMIEKGFDYAYEAQTYKEYVRYEAIGDGGSIAWDMDTGRLRVHTPTQTLDEPLSHGGKDDVRTILYQGFIDSVKQGALLDWLASGEDGLAAIEAAQAATDRMLAQGVVRRPEGPAANWFDGREGELGRG